VEAGDQCHPFAKELSILKSIVTAQATHLLSDDM
jgi:hypothetical protein